MMTQAEFEALLQRYLDDRSLPGEREMVERWSKQLGNDAPPELSAVEQEEVRSAMWARIVALTDDDTAQDTTDNVVARPLSFWREPFVQWAAAAVCVLGLGLGWLLLQRPRTGTAEVAAQRVPQWVQRTNAGSQVQQLALADGSRVTLHPGSKLRYRDGLAGRRREVYLTGQAFFKVAKNPDRPFLVYTDNLVTTVLGTSFMVTSYAGQEAQVAVREGRVAVQQREGAQLEATPAQPAVAGVLLLPNQQVVYSAAEPKLRKELVSKPEVLVPQTLAFRNRPVEEVLASLEKAYGVTIVYDPARLKSCTITIAFDNEPLFDQLDILCKALGASYKLANDANILFDTKGC